MMIEDDGWTDENRDITDSRGINARLDRRSVLKAIVAAAGVAVSSNAYTEERKTASTVGAGHTMKQGAGAKSYFVYVGCRTSRERNARGDGINVYRMDAESGRWSHVQLLGGLVNPSFLAFDRNRRFLYTVHGDASEISSFSINEGTGEIKLINQRSTRGKNPVHLSIDPSNRFVVVANHITTNEVKSSVVSLPINANDGSLGEVVDLVTFEGRKIGPHRVEQPFSKPHQVEFDPAGKFIVVPDKGLDAVFTLRLDAANGKLIASEPPFVGARETSGPRHIAFHPTLPYTYVINELDSTVTAYRYDAGQGRLTPFQIVSSLPDTYTGNSRGSEIAVSRDGRFVYGSNRGFDSVVVFSVDASTGRLTPVDWTPSQGKTPRFFALDPTGRYMYVANEESDTIITFRVDRNTGKLSPAGDIIKTGSPVCIVFRKTV